MENSLPHILQHINNWTELQNLKLETFIGIACASQLLPLSVLSCLNKDYLVKEGASLRFITQVFKVYLQEQSIEHFSNISFFLLFIYLFIFNINFPLLMKLKVIKCSLYKKYLQYVFIEYILIHPL